MPTSATGDRANRRAFTLVELLVVLTIVVVLAGIVVARMGSSILRRDLAESAARLAHTCRAARELAVASRQTCALELDLDAGAYAVTRQAGQGESDTWEAAKAVWLKPHRMSKDVRIASCRTPEGTCVSAGRFSVRFFADGRSNGATVELAADGDNYSVVVRPATGRAVYGHTRQLRLAPDEYDLGDG